MSFWSFIRSKRGKEDNYKVIPEEVFVNNEDPLEDVLAQKKNRLHAIYVYAGDDYEDRGYQDALTNPDKSYKDDNFRLLCLDLDILIKKVSLEYDDYVQDLEFHIRTRKEAGLIDIVQQLESNKLKADKAILEIDNIIRDLSEPTGLKERIRLSYEKGFNRGLASISKQLLEVKGD